MRKSEGGLGGVGDEGRGGDGAAVLILLMATVYLFICLSIYLLSISLLAPEEDNVSKALACDFFFVFRRIGKYISLDLSSMLFLFFSCFRLLPVIKF